ncbi:MAG TPA: 50S ribosomal protein L4, partial [candidate division Zixibacteria bacterium]|nr:50S ribosomal protein L4 [candidate division Zixibacteria bacterium]
MIVSVLNQTGREIGTVDLPASIFEANVNRDLMHQALVRQMANARRGTHNTKTRAEVNRTTAKWYRQKGTGRARHGSKKAPIFVGGGVAHGPKPRSYRKDMPRKMRRAAIRSALSAKLASGDIVFLDDLVIDSPKTKTMVDTISNLADGTSTLVLIANADENIEKSTRNIADVKALRANYLNIRDILGYHKIVISLDALEVIQGTLAINDSTAVEIDMSG